MTNQVYVIVGDGECNEGSIWESAMSASNFELNNLTVIVDHNKYQQTGSNKEIMNLDKLREKWTSFGWDTNEINGHDIEKIKHSLSNTKKKKPLAIIANTIKGKGFSFSENNNNWHHAVMTKKFYDQAREELEKKFFKKMIEINDKNIKTFSIIGPRATLGLAAFEIAKKIINLQL